MTPLVSIIIPTRNSAATLAKCLRSIQKQSYTNIEIIVVDNNSTDKTQEIARKYSEKVFNRGPERSAQRNLGAAKSQGQYLLFIDSDMELSPDVVKACVEKIQANPKTKAVIIPEESFGEGFWAQCKKLERSFYVGVDWMEAARFYDRETFFTAGGFSQKMISGEDWDLSQKIANQHHVGRILYVIFHNEGRINLLQTIKKKLYYAQHLLQYIAGESDQVNQQKQISILQRYWLFISQPAKLFQHPLFGCGMLFMKTCEFVFGGAGYILEKIKKDG